VVNYGRYLVICCRSVGPQGIAGTCKGSCITETVADEDKTHIRKLPEESFDFWVTTLAVLSTADGKRHMWGTTVLGRASNGSAGTISELTSAVVANGGEKSWVERLIGLRVGWSNYFKLGPVTSLIGL